MSLPRLIVPIPQASADGKFYGRYPTGNAPVAGTGFYPAGHWTPAKFPFQNIAGQVNTQIHPRPDTETQSYARPHWMFYDGVTDFDNLFTFGLRGGAFPFVWSIIQAPPGTSFDAATWQSGWTNQDAFNAGYGRLRVRPQSDYANQTFWIRGTGQDGNYNDFVFTGSTVGGYYYNATTPADSYGFVFLDPVNGVDPTSYPSTSGIINMSAAAGGTPMKTLNWAWGPSKGTVSYPNSHVVLMPGTTPTFPQDPTYGMQVVAGASPVGIIGFPGQWASCTLDMGQPGGPTNAGTNMGVDLSSNVKDVFFQGFTVSGGNQASTGFRHFSALNVAARSTFDSISLPNTFNGSAPTDNAGPFTFLAEGSAHTYTFFNGISQTNASTPGNVFAVHDMFEAQYGLTQFSDVVNSTEETHSLKGSCSDWTVQCCDVYSADEATAQFMFWHGGFPTGGSADGNLEWRYCNGIGPQTSDYSCIGLNTSGDGNTTAVYVYRCTLLGCLGYYNNAATGPFQFEDLVIQYGTASGPFLINKGDGWRGSGVQVSGLPSNCSYGTADVSGNGQECIGKSGITDSDGNLLPAYQVYAGRRGALITL